MPSLRRTWTSDLNSRLSSLQGAGQPSKSRSAGSDGRSSWMPLAQATALASAGADASKEKSGPSSAAPRKDRPSAEANSRILAALMARVLLGERDAHP